MRFGIGLLSRSRIRITSRSKRLRPGVDYVLGWGVNRDTLALEGGDIVFVPGLHVTHALGEVIVVVAREFSATRTLGGPGFIREWDAARPRSVTAPAL